MPSTVGRGAISVASSRIPLQNAATAHGGSADRLCRAGQPTATTLHGAPPHSGRRTTCAAPCCGQNMTTPQRPPTPGGNGRAASPVHHSWFRRSGGSLALAEITHGARQAAAAGSPSRVLRSCQYPLGRVVVQNAVCRCGKWCARGPCSRLVVLTRRKVGTPCCRPVDPAHPALAVGLSVGSPLDHGTRPCLHRRSS